MKLSEPPLKQIMRSGPLRAALVPSFPQLDCELLLSLNARQFYSNKSKSTISIGNSSDKFSREVSSLRPSVERQTNCHETSDPLKASFLISQFTLTFMSTVI